MVDTEPTDTCGCEMEYEGGGTYDEEYVCGCIHCSRCKEWYSKEDHEGGVFPSSGVCYECTCDDCGKRIETDDLNDMSCEPCMDIAMAKKDARSAEGWCYDCDEEKAVGVFWNKTWETNMPLCLACLGEQKQADRAMDEFKREPNMAEFVRFGIDLEDEDFQKSLPDDLE